MTINKIELDKPLSKTFDKHSLKNETEYYRTIGVCSNCLVGIDQLFLKGHLVKDVKFICHNCGCEVTASQPNIGVPQG